MANFQQNTMRHTRNRILWPIHRKKGAIGNCC
ncbi:unnamed protein product [Nyctereutes procyonoides]|uniref:(raccoon dog) hypothetical protein n=1 Tax=Nyctereutes procyonoides TaxID=34880 RepID=A0A811ZRU9_NYCPR|nr:unnamed protein product [Nyctereutes procyonoides]